MIIGVDATCWQNNRGYGRHCRALLRALLELDSNNTYRFYMDSEDYKEPLPPGVELKLVSNSKPTTVAASASGSRSLSDMWRMGRAMSDASLDILLFPTIYSFVPVISRSKKIVMIHDIIAERFPELTMPRRLGRMFWNAKVALGRRQATALVTVSEHARQGIAEHFRLDPDRIFVVGEASDPAFQVIDNPEPSAELQKLGVGKQRRRDIVYVGGFGPHKNLEMLVDVFGRVCDQEAFQDCRLIMVGEYKNEVFHSYYGKIRQRVENSKLKDRIVFSGFLSDEDLVVLLNLAHTLVLPSLLEGFGLPAVEACACGLPVIATTASPLPDLLGPAGIFVDPSDTAGWENALTQMLSSKNDWKRMHEAGTEVAAKLTWGNAARQMLDVIDQVAK